MSFEVGIACGTCGTFAALHVRFCAYCGSSMTLARDPASGDEEPIAFSPTPLASKPVVLETEKGAAAAAAVQSGQSVPKSAPEGVSADASRPGEKPRIWTPEGTKPLAAAQAAQQDSQVSKEDLMEQARHYVCKECSTPVPSGHKFCGRCGAVVPPQILDLRTDFFGAMQAPGKARLILIRGDAGADGLSYLLQGTEHVAGKRDGQIVFPDDIWLSPRHANFVYRGEKLVVRDEGSLNGVYVRVRGQISIDPGDLFLCGEQVFRLDRTPADTSGPDPDMTYFYSSPKRPSPFRIVQALRGGGEGMVVCARENQSSIGREDCDLNFPEDVYMSANHARIVASPDGSFMLVDNNSKNGTYVRIRGERELSHGDYLFLGKQLLRVEITA
jgi:pSer/pThr/pTyr-binding forkhead associated (FHA) protein